MASIFLYVYMAYYTDYLTHTKLFLHSQDESFLIMVYGHFNVLFESVG